MRFFKYYSVLFLLILVLSSGCAKRTVVEDADFPLPQDADYYLRNSSLVLPSNSAELLKNNYLRIWYSPWTNPVPNPKASEVFWIAPGLLKLKGYGLNLREYTQDQLQKIHDSLDVSHYPSAATKAIITRHTMVRAVPTNQAFFKSRDNFPFDRWQNSLIFSGTPVLITHFNPTKEWVHIQSSFVYGWVRAEDVGRVSPEDEKLLTGTQDYLIPNRDNIPLYNKEGDFIYLVRMGEILPMKKEMSRTSQNLSSKTSSASNDKEKKDEFYEVYLPYRNTDGMAQLVVAKVRVEDFSRFPQKFEPITMANIVDAMLGETYGWGGMFESRDCSAFVRDSFASFGIFLPRNSASQVKYANNMIDLSTMSSDEKEKYIIENATPFATILWLQGHIMLYIGTYEGRAVIAHSAWSVMTENTNSRVENLLGGAVITTLTPENEKNGTVVRAKTLLDRILGMSDLYEYILELHQPEKVQ